MKIHAVSASVINWVGNCGIIQRSRTGFAASFPPVILIYGRYSQKKFFKDVDNSMETNIAHYISECQTYTLEIV